MELILGSQSPRRKEILGYFSYPFVQVSPHFDEESIPFEGDPAAYALRIAGGKADSLAAQFSHAVILTADTVVVQAGKIYGKPRNREEAYQTLQKLSGQWHTVYTGVAVQKGERSLKQAEVSQILFNDLSHEQIELYLDRTQWADKAGGYAIQMPGGLIVRKIEGCYYNAMGLPVNTTVHLLKSFGIDLWYYL